MKLSTWREKLIKLIGFLLAVLVLAYIIAIVYDNYYVTNKIKENIIISFKDTCAADKKYNAVLLQDLTKTDKNTTRPVSTLI